MLNGGHTRQTRLQRKVRGRRRAPAPQGYVPFIVDVDGLEALGARRLGNRGPTPTFDRCGLGPSNGPCRARSFEEPDNPGGRVQLALVHTVAGEGGAGMVEVVPVVAHRKDRQRSKVGGPVRLASGEWSFSPQVTRGIDGECAVVQHEYSYQAAPDKPTEGARPRSG